MPKVAKNKLESMFRGMIYVLPGVLFFSYWPLISLGANESMNFKISLPLVWLVVFDVLVLVMGWRKRDFWRGILKRWMWLLLPLWLSLSVLWSLNSLRGLLVVGIVWLIYLAIYGFFEFRSLMREAKFRDKFWKVFFGSSLVICAWCWLQCILDLCGVSREVSLMCAGCTYEMFGFPHPDGFAIEPQFMGNLLLAPVIVAGYLAFKDRKYLILFFVLAATLFLTFSRGAIYAFIVAMLVMTVWKVVQTRKWKMLLAWPVIVVAFLFTLNMQGVMAAASPTNDTYRSGVAKVLNHLTLGVVDVRENVAPVPVSVSVSTEEESTASKTESVFSGYVPESTDTRLILSDAAAKVWSKNPATAIFGVGLGGAGQALYENELTSSPKEIIQNQYASLLLETGLLGMGLLIFSLVLVVKVIWRSKNREMILTLVVAYMITLCFFSGLPNALQIYLLPALLMGCDTYKGLRKKLVS